MPELTATLVAGRAVDLGLLSDAQALEVWSRLDRRITTAEDFCQLAIKNGYLTRLQGNRLQAGETSGFFHDGYKVLDLVGEGAFARVFSAEHKDSGEKVALKILRNRYCSDRAETNRFSAEARLGMKLQHANIVRIHDVLSKKKVHLMRMELVEGSNVRELLEKRGRIETVEALKIIEDISRGLGYAFKRGVTHRDVRMSNVLVSNAGTAKLIDFGLAADQKETKSNNPRTIEYSVLEKLTDVQRGDIRSDIYFCGCLLYRMLAGKSPLDDSTSHLKKLRPSSFRDVVPLKKLDPSLPRPAALVTDYAMRLDADRRYQTPMEFREALERAIERIGEQPDEDANVELAKADQPLEPEPAKRQTVMVIDSDASFQTMLRKHLKSQGYRVLTIAQPSIAMGRLRREPGLADCVIFSTQELGLMALKAFNDSGKVAWMKDRHAVLLLGRQHEEWKQDAQLNEHRIAVQAPLKVKELIGQLKELLNVKISEEPSASRRIGFR